MKLIITIDTEEDNWGDYKPTGHTVENIERIPYLQELFDEFNVKPTYLITYPVATNEKSISILKKILDEGKCEIGAHCHPWNTPPFEEEINEKNSMLNNLPYYLIKRKLEALHEAIFENFKLEPVCFRAGRWGFGPQVAKSICNLGYRVDTSVTPLLDWTANGGPDFSHARTSWYRFDPSDILIEKSDGRLLEVPPTIGFFQKNFILCFSIRKLILKTFLSKCHFLGLLDRLKLLNFRWLSPELSSGSEMIRLARTLCNLGYNYLNMSFHSTSLLIGKSPFVQNQDKLDKYLENIEVFLKYAADKNMSFLPLSDAISEENGLA